LLKVKIITVGQDKDNWVSESCQHFQKLLKKYCRLNIITITSLKLSNSLSPDEIKKKELKVIKNKLSNGLIIALSDKGKEFDSHSFAKQMEKWQTQNSTLQFIIGGAYGLDASFLKSTNTILSLSKLTFSHQLIRPILLEQLFRAFSIIHNTDYHK